MQKHTEWPVISALPVKVKSSKEVGKPKSYPFTVEVIEEDASNPKLDFRNDEIEIHANAHVLNDASSWQCTEVYYAIKLKLFILDNIVST